MTRHDAICHCMEAAGRDATSEDGERIVDGMPTYVLTADDLD